MLFHPAEPGTDAWRLARFGVPSASNFSRIVTAKGARSSSLEGYAAELAGEVFAGKSLDQFDGNVWMNRGKEKEAEAIELYRFTTDAKVEQCGFIVLDDESAGCTPDALVDEDGLLECKCLKAERHVAAMHYYQKHNRPPTDYIQQTQGQLMITGRAWVDLMFYHPDLPPLIIRQTPDLVFQAALKEGIAAVIAERDAQIASLRRHQTHIGG